MASEAVHAHADHAHAKQAFIWRYVFSKDHKVIGIQYYVTAMLMALVAGLLAMLIRVQLAWPEKDYTWLGKIFPPASTRASGGLPNSRIITRVRERRAIRRWASTT